MSEDIRLYIADLAAYNAGELHGIWINITHELEDIQEQIREMLAQSSMPNSEEFAIHDYEGFEGYQVGEYDDLKTLHQIGNFIAEFPDLGGEVLSHFNGNLDEARGALEDQYRGCYSSLSDFAQELTEETTDIPQSLEGYIDYERVARDLETGGDVFTIETSFEKVHVFWNN